MEKFDRARTALLVIDVQMAFEAMKADQRPRSNPDGESNIAQLLAAFRARDWRVIHVHHDSIEPQSPFRPGLPGNAVQPFAAPAPGEACYRKTANGAFVGTSLEADLRSAGIETLVLCGATANHCVETTARMAENLGFDVRYVGDATWAYDAVAPDGTVHAAGVVHSVTLANIALEFGTVVSTQEIVRALDCGR